MDMLLSVFRSRFLIAALTRRDLQSRYIGTLGGSLWTFVHPLLLIGVFYVVFSFGFKAKGPGGSPFALWFVCGMVPWLFFSEALQAATGSITRSASLIKKTTLPPEILPIVPIVSGLVNHGIFLVIFLGMLVWFRVDLGLARLSLVWFLFSLCSLLIGLSWLLAALQVFYRDISHVVTAVLNLWFWATPIVWSSDMIASQYRGLLLLNPMYYVVEGYRGSLIDSQIRWPESTQAITFWCVVFIVLAVGMTVFKRLKPEFVDAL
ncbi:MAG: ABC transporter permease [Nitrospira sp.]|nr:ABC transporter permease [Nitrospira sp.]